MKRAIILYTAFALAVWGLNLRIARLGAPEVSKTYAPNSVRVFTAAASRGYIYDRNYIPLVNATVTHMAAVIPYDGIERELTDNASAEEMQRILKGKPCLVTVKNRRPDSKHVRYFDVVNRYDEVCAAHIIGYTDSSGQQGLAGMEKSFDGLLQESAGKLQVRFSVDGKGNALPNSDIEILNDGYNAKGGLRLTLDSEIQKKCNAAAAACGLDVGAIVVLRADTAEIAAAVGYPAYDPADVSASLQEETAPFLNRFLCEYAVGSVFKPITAAAALETGVSETRRYCCTGSIQIGDVTFHCHNRDGHGELDMSGAMANSCNTYFISLAEEIGAAPILTVAKAMGLGKTLELAQGYASDAGTLPEKAELANAGGVANLAFGQGSLTATPLQMAAVYACIANHGLYTPPYLLREQLNPDGDSIAQFIPDAPTRVLSAATADVLHRLLTDTVEKGSGQSAKPAAGTAAGKTATAQSGVWENGRELLRTWFCGYFPAENPQYVVVVLKENGDSPITDCAPIFKFLAENI